MTSSVGNRVIKTGLLLAIVLVVAYQIGPRSVTETCDVKVEFNSTGKPVRLSEMAGVHYLGMQVSPCGETGETYKTKTTVEGA